MCDVLIRCENFTVKYVALGWLEKKIILCNFDDVKLRKQIQRNNVPVSFRLLTVCKCGINFFKQR